MSNLIEVLEMEEALRTPEQNEVVYMHGQLIQVLAMDETSRTPEQNEAVYMHGQIVASCRSVCEGLVGLGRNLKQMRDKKLYLQLGYKEFGEYTEAEHGIKQRMAYNYIRGYEKLGAEFLQSNAKLGITKLLEIATLDRDEREELMSDHTVDELSDMSSEEVKQLTEKVKKLQEQISFLEAEKENAPLPTEVVQQPFDELEAEIRADVEKELEAQHAAEIDDLKSKISELESNTDEELKKYRANAEKEAKAAAAEEMKKLKADLKTANEAKKAKIAELDKILEEKKKAEERANNAEEQAKRMAELEAKINAAEAAKSEVEKQIRLSSDPEFTRFKFLFEAWQNATNALVEQLGKLDADKQTKSKAAVRKVVEVNGL